MRYLFLLIFTACSCEPDVRRYEDGSFEIIEHGQVVASGCNAGELCDEVPFGESPITVYSEP